MIVLVALAVGIGIGSLPTADWLARRRGIDLRSSGTGNPGTNNALQTGGKGLAAAVFAVELAKGFAAVWAGYALATSGGAALAGMGATLGNVYNPWFRLRGGKGLAITAGTVLAAWPSVALALFLLIASGMAVFKRSGPAALVTISVYLALALAGLGWDMPGRWAVTEPRWALVMAAGQSLTMLPKHLGDLLTPDDRHGSRGGS